MVEAVWGEGMLVEEQGRHRLPVGIALQRLPPAGTLESRLQTASVWALVHVEYTGAAGRRFEWGAHRVVPGQVGLHLSDLPLAEGLDVPVGVGSRHRNEDVAIGVSGRVLERIRAVGGVARVILKRLHGRERVRGRAEGQHCGNSWRSGFVLVPEVAGGFGLKFGRGGASSDGAKPRQRWHPAGSDAPTHRGVIKQRRRAMSGGLQGAQLRPVETGGKAASSSHLVPGLFRIFRKRMDQEGGARRTRSVPICPLSVMKSIKDSVDGNGRNIVGNGNRFDLG